MASNFDMNPEKFRNTFQAINHGTVMEAAARNLQKEMLRDAEAAAKAAEGASRAVIDMQDLEQARSSDTHQDTCQDEELEQIHRDRIAQMKREAEKRAAMSTKGHGSYEEVSEGEFLPAVTGSSHCVVHFYHNEFERCRILDKHLGLLAKQYFTTRFFKVHAPDAPFFVHKLGIQVLPCVVMFLEGKAYDRIVGFEEFGARDDFNTALLEQRLLNSGAVQPRVRGEDDSEDDDDAQRTRLRARLGVGAEDEDSDFD